MISPPPSEEHLLQLYRSIEAVSRDMLAAALDGDWDTVAQHQARCAELIDDTRTLAPALTLSRTQQTSRLQIMQRILQNEAVMRRLANPWTARLEQQLFSAYRPGSQTAVA